MAPRWQTRPSRSPRACRGREGIFLKGCIPRRRRLQFEHATVSDISAVIRAAAERYGLDPEYMLRKANIEAPGLDPTAQNPNSSAGGLFQFVDKTWKAYGRGADKYDPAANADAAARLTLDNRNALRAGLGRDPTAGELYLAHQQGAGGALKLLRDPNAVVGGDAIRLNGGRDGMTAGDFARKWTSRFDGAAPAPATATAYTPDRPLAQAMPPESVDPAIDLTPVAAAFQQSAAAQRPRKMASGVRLL